MEKATKQPRVTDCVADNKQSPVSDDVARAKFELNGVHTTDAQREDPAAAAPDVESCGDREALKHSRQKLEELSATSVDTNLFQFYFDLFICAFTIGLLMTDYIFNVFLIYKYYELQRHHRSYVIYFWLSLAFSSVPPAMGSFFEFVWIFEEKYKTGHKPSATFRCIQGIFSAILLAPVLKFFMSIVFGIRSRDKHVDPAKRAKHVKSMNHERSDGAFLCVIEKFVESSLHLIHQSCLVRTEWLTEHSVYIDWMEWFKMGISLFLLPYTVTLYVAFYRKTHNKNHMTVLQGLVHFVWRLLIITSQAVSLSVFALFHPVFFGAISGVHYVLSVLFVFLQQPKFFLDADVGSEVFYRFAVSYVYFFTYLNVAVEDTFYKTFVFYGLMFIERAIMIMVWAQYITGSVDLALYDLTVSAYFVTFLAGITIMILYYLYFHPTREFPSCKLISRRCTPCCK